MLTDIEEITTPVSLTATAIAELKRLHTTQAIDDTKALRVGVKGGGCSGMTYVLDFDAIEPDDKVFDMDGLKVIMKKSHELYLHGITVNYSDGLNARGFEFINPNAKTTCGCGTSFSA